jgi:acyl carrier protein
MSGNSLRPVETLKAILLNLGIPNELLHEDALLNQDLQIDSTEAVEISLELKRRLGVTIKLESSQDKSLAEICQMVEAAMSGVRNVS